MFDTRLSFFDSVARIWKRVSSSTPLPSALSGQMITGVFAYAALDDVTHSVQGITHEHHENHEGNAFRFYDSLTIASAATQDYLITTPNTTKWAHLTFRVDGSAITSFVLYEGSDKTGTSAQTVWNADRNSATVATTTVHKGTSGGTTDGTAFVTYGSGSASNQSNGDSNREHANEFILKQNTKYILRVTSGTNGNLVNVALDWYEHISMN